MSTRLIRQAEEREKEERAQDKRPAEHLESENTIGVILPNGCWDLVHHGVVCVRVGPAFPRIDTQLRIFHDDKRSQRNGSKYFGGRNDHQTDVPATTETGRRHYLPEPTFARVEQVNVHDCD
jgi:hypothetical protein